MYELMRTIINGNVNKMNPTIIYNEGWMLRLLIYYSIQEEIKVKQLDFGIINNWTSEALISSPFISSKKSKEGYTHVDAALGNFEVNYTNRGQIIVNSNSKFGLIEAKMNSNLSQGVTNAPNYNQATRNITCIADNIKNKKCEAFFMIACPNSLVDKYQIHKQIELETVLSQLKSRFLESEFDQNYYFELEKIIKEISIGIITYEDWIEEFQDNELKQKLAEFYSKCKVYNRVK